VGVELPDLSLAEFQRQLAAASAPREIEPGVASRLHAHYEELRRWNRTLALVGPAFALEGLTEHYAESLAGLDLLTPTDREAVDIGSGAGFPGLILAAARTDIQVTLVEARERKCAFLLAAARRMALQVRCLNARLAIPPPQGLPTSIDVVTVRAVRLDSTLLAPVAPLLAGDGRVLVWTTGSPASLVGFSLHGERRLTGGRRILAYGRGL